MGKKKCKTCSKVSGIEAIPVMLLVGSVGAAVVADKINSMVTTNADGTPKTGYLADNPKVKDLAFVAAGAAATVYADGNEVVTGLGVGLAVFGGYNLIKGFMTPASTAGLGYVPPSHIAGVRHVPGAAGYSPGIMGYNMQGTKIPDYAQPQKSTTGIKFSAV